MSTAQPGAAPASPARQPPSVLQTLDREQLQTSQILRFRALRAVRVANRRRRRCSLGNWQRPRVGAQASAVSTEEGRPWVRQTRSQSQTPSVVPGR